MHPIHAQMTMTPILFPIEGRSVTDASAESTSTGTDSTEAITNAKDRCARGALHRAPGGI